MKYIKTRDLTREQWLQLRTEGIGGSDVSAILGLNQWRSPYQVWAEKTHRIEPGGSDNEFIHWGNVMEPILAKEFAQVTGKRVYSPNREYIHPEFDFLRANIDRDIEKEPGFLEIKTATEYKSSEWADGEVPAPYLLQVQHYMNVLDRPYVYFAYLIGGHHFDYLRVDRNQDLINAFTPKIIDWWRTYVEGDQEPPVDGSASTTDTLKAMYPNGQDEGIVLSGTLNHRLSERFLLKNQGKELDSAVATIDNEIRQLMGPATLAENDQYKITYRENKRGTRVLRVKEKE